MKATTNDIKKINDLYEGRRAYFGDLHNHAETGGTPAVGGSTKSTGAELQLIGTALIFSAKYIRLNYHNFVVNIICP